MISDESEILMEIIQSSFFSFIENMSFILRQLDFNSIEIFIQRKISCSKSRVSLNTPQ